MSKNQTSYRILGVDVGTTGCKCVAFDGSMRVLAESFAEYSLIHGSAGEVEQDPDVWWNAVIETIRETTRASEGAGPVRGIGVSSQGITFVPVDSMGNPLMNALTWLDKRADLQCSELVEKLGVENIYRITGKRSNAVYTLPKLMWLNSEKPEIYNKTYKFLMAHDYIINRLCGAFVTEHSLAAGSMAYDIAKREWSNKILGETDMHVEKLPVILESGTIAGTLANEAAELLGLDVNVVVSTGGQDQKCAAYGAGLSKNDITVSLGTSAAITALCEKPVYMEDMALPCFPHVDGRNWVLEGFSSTAGASVKWFRDNLANGKTYKEIDSEIEKFYKDGPASGNVMFFPYLGGTGSPEWYDTDGGGFTGITLDTTMIQMAAAVLESTAFNIRANIEKMESIGGKFQGITVFGGGANSNIWLKIIADVTGKIVKVPGHEETACLGAAMKALESLGVSYSVRREKWKSIIPDADKSNLYDIKYFKYKGLEKKIFGGV